jgi:hypothetical protein
LKTNVVGEAMAGLYAEMAGWRLIQRRSFVGALKRLAHIPPAIAAVTWASERQPEVNLAD